MRRIANERKYRGRWQVTHPKERNVEVRVGADGIQCTARVQCRLRGELRVDVLAAVVRAAFDTQAQGERGDPALAHLAARFKAKLRVVGRAVASTHSRETG